MISACKSADLRGIASLDEGENAKVHNNLNIAMPVSDFVTEAGEFPSSHSATLAEIPGKKLIACWYAGAREGAEDVEIYCRKQSLDHNLWEDKVTAVAKNEKTNGNILSNKTVGNPVLFYNDEDLTLYLFYVVRTFGGWTLSEVAYKASKDFGRTWSEGTILETRLERRASGKLTRSLPIKLEPGKILLPLYYELSYKKIFEKAGYTCELDLFQGKLAKKNCNDIPGGGHLQPTLVQVGQKVFAYLRSGNPEAKIETAVLDLSNGYSETSAWQKTTNLNLPNPNSSVAAAKTSDGKILLVYNSAGGRNILNLAISDDGQNFRELYKFEDGKVDEVGNEFSYPTLFQDSDRVFHVVYTHKRTAIKHVKFTEQWLGTVK
jgi:predicted neuraminidase